jgi:peptide/nickel transport system substrate-binding protein
MACASLLTGLALLGGSAATASVRPHSVKANIPQHITFATAQQTLTSLNPFDGKWLEGYDSIFDGLVKITPTGGVTPDLATNWLANRTDTVWVFNIRHGVKFWDGTPLTASEIAWNYTMTLDNPKFTNHIYLVNLQSINAVGKYQVRFIFSKPYPFWPRETSLVNIIEEEQYQRLGAAASDAQPMGTGAYELVSWDGATTVQVKANPHYWAGAPKIPTMTIDVVQDETARLQGVESGTLDAALLSSNQIRTARSDSSLTTKVIPSNKVVYLGYNTSNPLLANKDIRLAATYAIDRRVLSNRLLDGQAHPIDEMVPPAVQGYSPNIKVPAYNLAKAKALVRASGYSGQPIVFDYPTTSVSPDPVDVAQAIASDLEAAGLNITLEANSSTAYSAKWFGKQLGGIYLFAFTPSTMDAGLIADFGYGKSGPEYFDDPSLRNLTIASHTEVYPAKRLAIFARMWNITNQQGYYVPLFDDAFAFASDSKVTVTPRADGYIIADEIQPKS